MVARRRAAGIGERPRPRSCRSIRPIAVNGRGGANGHARVAGSVRRDGRASRHRPSPFCPEIFSARGAARPSNFQASEARSPHRLALPPFAAQTSAGWAIDPSGFHLVAPEHQPARVVLVRAAHQHPRHRRGGRAAVPRRSSPARLRRAMVGPAFRKGFRREHQAPATSIGKAAVHQECLALTSHGPAKLKCI